jgi:hypothetical protein
MTKQEKIEELAKSTVVDVNATERVKVVLNEAMDWQKEQIEGEIVRGIFESIATTLKPLENYNNYQQSGYHYAIADVLEKIKEYDKDNKIFSLTHKDE